jgi:hypothetical protein
MTLTKQNPAAANCGAPKNDLADGLIASDNTKSLKVFQARRLVRLYAVNSAMAEAIAPLVFVEVVR